AMNKVLAEAKRIVVKVGSSLVTDDGRGLDEHAIGEWSRQLAALARDGREVIMVSSGAIAEGMNRLGWTGRPHEVHELQAAVAGGAGSSMGKGGMITKVLAAKRAAQSGASTAIAWGREPDCLLRLARGEIIGTLLVAPTQKNQARKRWIADHLQLRGAVSVDD